MTDLIRPAGGATLALALAMLLAGGAAAQDSLEIRADGPDVSNSAAGADNVRMERNPGRQQANSGDGQGNQEVRRAPRDNQRQRDRSERRNRNNNNNNGGETAPVEGYGEGWVPEPEAAAIPDGGSETRPVQLPSTGVGIDPSLPVALVASIAAAAAAAGVRRRR